MTVKCHQFSGICWPNLCVVFKKDDASSEYFLRFKPAASEKSNMRSYKLIVYTPASVHSNMRLYKLIVYTPAADAAD